MKRFLMPILLLCLGCAHAPVVVKEPVAVPCPAPPAIARPHLPIASLRRDDPPAVVMKAYAASLEALSGYARELEAILQGYRHETTSTGKQE
jgi:hypothetical protein